MSVYSHISKITVQTSLIFCACCLWPWLSLSLATMLCTTSDVDDVMFARRLSSVSSPMPVDKKWPMIIGKWYRMEM